MITIFEKNTGTRRNPPYSKHEQFVQGMINAIDERIIFKGEALPSINVLIKELGFARETVMKGYRKLISRILNEYEPGSVEKGKVYFTLNNSEIWKILKDCEAKKLKPGKDIGILSHNDEVVKEIIGGGLTTYSADFSLMGKKVAQAVLKKERVQETIPTVLIRRKSL